MTYVLTYLHRLCCPLLKLNKFILHVFPYFCHYFIFICKIIISPYLVIFNAIFLHILFSGVKIYRIVVFSDRARLQLCTEIVFQQRFLKYLAIKIVNLFLSQVPVVKRPVLFVEEDKARGCKLGVEERSNCSSPHVR